MSADRTDGSSVTPLSPSALHRVEVPALDRVAQVLERFATLIENQGASHLAREAEATSLVGEAKIIAESLRTVAAHVEEQKRIADAASTQRFRSFLKSLLSLPRMAALLAGLVGAAWTLEGFFQHTQEAARVQAESTFTAARNQLASSQAAIQADALRSIYKLAFIQAVVEPDRYVPGAFTINRFRNRMEYPFMSQCRSLFREFAIQERIVSSMENNVVSSAILESGVAWQMREQALGNGSDIGAQGSLLFRARVPRAQAIHLVCDGINFGAADFSSSNLSDSQINECGLVGVNLRESNLNGCGLRNTVLTEASLQKVDLSFAKCAGAFFRKADFTDAIFKQADLSKADFTGAILDRAKFSQSILSKTSFKGASLKGAVFSQTDISTAEFDGADLDETDFTTAVGVTKVNWTTASNVSKARMPTTNPQPQTPGKP